MNKIFISAFSALAILTGTVHTAFADNYKILAIRVDFPYEEPDHETTSGRGTFDLNDYYSDETVKERYFHPWDIPPHDSLYFDNHLKALDNYWQTVSEGRIAISWDIWPQNARGAYTMSKKFYKYGNGRTDEQINEKLVGLFKEAVDECKRQEGDGINFYDYDTFMIIHAGTGQETSGGLNDIRSAYLSGEDFVTYLDSTLKIDGVEFDNGIIVPEMASSNGVGGLNGILAQMFGHRLGLPSLSNNEDGLPGAGGWCLMDTGSMAWGYRTRGFVPTHPCAWSKIELGWIEPVTVTADTTIEIAATHISRDLPRAVKIPLTGDEYLLIENRLRYASRDSLASAVYSDTDSSGVWMTVDHYDSYIPGSGLLIWHINDSIIREKRAPGAINNDPLRRGIDLLEADGRQDIGAMFGFGDERAEYSEGHDDDTYKLGGTDVLSPLTNPNSGSMWGGWSGITVQALTGPGEIMGVSIMFSGKMKGFPLDIGKESNITAVDMDGNGAEELIVSAGDTTFVFGVDGHRYGSLLSYSHPCAVYNETTGNYDIFAVYKNEISLFQMTDNELSGPLVSSYDVFAPYSIKYEGPYATTISENNQQTIISPMRKIEDNSGKTLSSSLSAISNIDNMAFNIDVAFPDTAHINYLSAAYHHVAALGSDNTLYLGRLNDEMLTAHPIDAEYVSGPVMTDLNRDDVYETIVVTDSELLIYQPDGSYDSAFLPDKPVGEPVAADIDSDGYPEILQCTEKGLYAFRSGGVPVDGFPYYLPPGNPDERITSSPVVADLSGNGVPDIAFATSGMRLVSYDNSGLPTYGFPLALTGTVENSPVVFKHDNTGAIAIAYITTDGMLMAHDLGVTADDELLVWPMWKGGPALNSALLNSEISAGIKESATFKAYCYPNPITGGTGTFRITPDSPTDCTITVYTADGRRVFERHLTEGELIPGVPNEVRMNASKLASGLYIARIKTRGGTITYKLGVLK